MSETSNKPHVLTLSSFVSAGSVGNRATVFALQTLKFPVWSVNTINLPWHPGHGSSTKIIPDPELFGDFLNDLSFHPESEKIGAVLSGYMASARQVLQTADLIRTLKRRRPDLIYLCDPVLGDHGNLYVDAKVARAIRDELLPLADIVTPNSFEAAWLTGTNVPETVNEAVNVACLLGSSVTLLTSCPVPQQDQTGILLLEAGNPSLCIHPMLNNPPKGSGDLFAAVFLGHLLAGRPPVSAMQAAASTGFQMLELSLANGADEIILEGNWQSILEPVSRTVLVPVGESEK